MKKYLFKNGMYALIGGMLTFIGCDLHEENFFADEDITELEASLNLVAPNGYRIAANITELKHDIDLSDEEIVSIEYIEVKESLYAIIEYLTSDDEVSNVVRCFNKGSKVKTKSEDTDSPVCVNVKCVPKNGGKCKKCMVRIDGTTGKCSCICFRPRDVSGSTECELNKTVK